MSDLRPPIQKWVPWMKGVYATLAVVVIALGVVAGMVVSAADRTQQTALRASQALRDDMAKLPQTTPPPVVLIQEQPAPKTKVKTRTEVRFKTKPGPDLSGFPECKEKHDVSQYLCVWDDGTGDIVLNVNYGKQFVLIPRK